MRSVSPESARRIALAAQGFGVARPRGNIDVRHYRRVFRAVGQLQLDSVNVIARSHYLPVLARLGPYNKETLDRYTASSGEVFEYWGHAASLIPVERHRLFRWRMQTMKPWNRVMKLKSDDPGYLDAVRNEVALRGPIGASDLEDPGARTGPWWGYGKGKTALEWLFATGQITAYRTPGFQRLYDLPERVIPSQCLSDETPTQRDAYKELLVLSAEHHGIGTAADLVDYYRLHLLTARSFLGELVAEGRLVQVEVGGWDEPAYLDPGARLPRRMEGTALLSPFDSVVWLRERALRLFGFQYRIEIYVPKQDRRYGYYVLPVLHNGDLVARVDLKAHRSEGRLEVKGAFAEAGVDLADLAGPLAECLREMAAWQGLAQVDVASHGDLATALQSTISEG